MFRATIPELRKLLHSGRMALPSIYTAYLALEALQVRSPSRRRYLPTWAGQRKGAGRQGTEDDGAPGSTHAAAWHAAWACPCAPVSGLALGGVRSAVEALTTSLGAAACRSAGCCDGKKKTCMQRQPQQESVAFVADHGGPSAVSRHLMSCLVPASAPWLCEFGM